MSVKKKIVFFNLSEKGEWWTWTHTFLHSLYFLGHVCHPSPCLHGGHCRVFYGHSKCYCPPLYKGNKCESTFKFTFSFIHSIFSESYIHLHVLFWGVVAKIQLMYFQLCVAPFSCSILMKGILYPAHQYGSTSVLYLSSRVFTQYF